MYLIEMEDGEEYEFITHEELLLEIAEEKVANSRLKENPHMYKYLTQIKDA